MSIPGQVKDDVSVYVNFNHVLKFSVDDEVDDVAEWLSKVKLYAKITDLVL